MHETITNALHRLREIGSNTPRPRRHRWERYNVRMTSENVLAFAYLNPQLRVAEISKTNGYAHHHVLYLLHTNGMHPYHPTPVQSLKLWEMVDYCNFILIPLRKCRRSFVTFYRQMSQLSQCWHHESPQCALLVSRKSPPTHTQYNKRYHSTIKDTMDKERVMHYMEIPDCGPIFFDGALTCDCYLNLLQNTVRDCYEDLFPRNSCREWFQYNGPLCIKHQMLLTTKCVQKDHWI